MTFSIRRDHGGKGHDDDEDDEALGQRFWAAGWLKDFARGARSEVIRVRRPGCRVVECQLFGTSVIVVECSWPKDEACHDSVCTPIDSDLFHPLYYTGVPLSLFVLDCLDWLWRVSAPLPARQDRLCTAPAGKRWMDPNCSFDLFSLSLSLSVFLLERRHRHRPLSSQNFLHLDSSSLSRLVPFSLLLRCL